MKKSLTLLTLLFSVCSFSQNIFFDNFSTFNTTTINGQNGWSSNTLPTGNGTGACVGVGCVPLNIVSKSISFPNFTSCTQALHPIDGTLGTGDGPGKSVGTPITSGSVYFAMLVNFTNPQGMTNPTGDKQLVSLFIDQYYIAGRMYIRQITTGGYFQFGIYKNQVYPAQYTTTTYNYNQDHLMILKYEFKSGSNTDDIVSVFIDPDLSQPEPTPTLSVTGGTDASAITRAALPWNVSTSIPNGYVGVISLARSWNTILPPATAFSISGSTLSTKRSPIKSSKIFLTSASFKDSMNTTQEGTFSFSNLSNSASIIKATKNNDITKANGINATDVLFTQRHILNTAKLNSAYKIIAADVNGDKVVNTTDVLRIKRLILGTDTTFTSATKGNRLWEFVDSSYIFPDTTNPFPFKDSISFTNLTSNKIGQTFIGIKLGDVNYDWNPAVAKQSTVNSIQLTANVDLKTINDELRIPITVSNFKDITAMQYTLHFDNSKYEFVNLEGFKNLQGFDYNTAQANINGNISFFWTDKNATEKTLDDGTELFVLVLRSTVNSRQTYHFL